MQTTTTPQICIANTRPQRGEKYVGPDQCRCPECWDQMETMCLNIGKAMAYQDALGYKTLLSLSDGDLPKNWTLDTVLIGDGTQKYRCFNIDAAWSGYKVQTTAKNGTIRELWKAAERSHKIAHERCGDWHTYLESIDMDENGHLHFFFGS